MIHYVYCVENVVNGKIYVGKHSTMNIDDGYMGSGLLLKEAFKKYGIENFKKYILAMCETENEAFQIEKQIVNADFVLSENTYNLREGGNGGYCEQARLSVIEMWKDSNHREKHRQRLSAMCKRFHAEGKFHPPNWNGRKHKQETKTKIGIANAIKQRGENNSQYGMIWIFNESQKMNRKIQQEELTSYLNDGWSKGRKMNFSSPKDR